MDENPSEMDGMEAGDYDETFSTLAKVLKSRVVHLYPLKSVRNGGVRRPTLVALLSIAFIGAGWPH